MTERKPFGVTWETWIDRQVREGMERGEFDGLPGHGQPIADVDRPRDELWWVKQKLAREGVLVPPPDPGRAQGARRRPRRGGCLVVRGRGAAHRGGDQREDPVRELDGHRGPALQPHAARRGARRPGVGRGSRVTDPFPRGRWRSRWIWADPATAAGEAPGRHTVALRTVVDLDNVPTSVPARLVANARYVLFVNGERVAQGPVRSNPRKQPYDDLDLAPHLRAGRNVIGALVVRYAGATAWYLPPPDFSNDLVFGAFVLEAHLGDDRWLTTDGAGWTGTVLDGWTATPGAGISGRGIELIDARSLPSVWLDEPGPGWPAALERRAVTSGEPGRHEPPSYPMGPFGPRPISWPPTAALELTASGDGAWLLDRIGVGTLVVDADGPAGAIVQIRTSEFLDGADRPAPTEHDAGATFTLDGTRRTLESLDTYGCRGVLVEASDGVTVRSVRLHERLHPVVGDATFRCSDDDLNQIWAVGRRTVSICSMDTYLDCPTREQRAWTGDSVVHQMVDLTTNTDWSLARWHPRVAASPRPDGMLPMACAGDAEQADFTIIPDWALHWVHSVWNLQQYVGDREEIARLLPVVEGVVRWFEPFCDEDGLPTDVYAWVIIDWASVYTEGVSASLCGLWGRALLELAELADWLGDAGPRDLGPDHPRPAPAGVRAAVGCGPAAVRRLAHPWTGAAHGLAARTGVGHRRRSGARGALGAPRRGAHRRGRLDPRDVLGARRPGAPRSVGGTTSEGPTCAAAIPSRGGTSSARSSGRSRSSATWCTTPSSRPVAPISSPPSASTGRWRSSAATRRSPRRGSAAPSATAGQPPRRRDLVQRTLGVTPAEPGFAVA